MANTSILRMGSPLWNDKLTMSSAAKDVDREKDGNKTSARYRYQGELVKRVVHRLQHGTGRCFRSLDIKICGSWKLTQ